MSFNPSNHNSTSNPMDASNEEIEQRDDAEEGGDQLHDDIDLEILGTTQQNENEETVEDKSGGAYNKGRMKKSTVWEHMVDVPEEDGTVTVQLVVSCLLTVISFINSLHAHYLPKDI